MAKAGADVLVQDVDKLPYGYVGIVAVHHVDVNVIHLQPVKALHKLGGYALRGVERGGGAFADDGFAAEDG